MTRHDSPIRRLASEAGFTIVEMLISALIMMTAVGAVFTLMNPSQGMFQAQPEMSELQQRLEA